jgi:hypothetical protein
MTSPVAWHDFYVMTGTGAIALAGLLFVAISLHLGPIIGSAAHRARAVLTLWGLAIVLLQSAFLLIPGQPIQLLALEILLLNLATIVALALTRRDFWGPNGVPSRRPLMAEWLAIAGLTLIGTTNCILLLQASVLGLSLFGVAIITVFAIVATIRSCWILLVAVEDDTQILRASREPERISRRRRGPN